jgi:hypothetical protein
VLEWQKLPSSLASELAKSELLHWLPKNLAKLDTQHRKSQNPRKERPGRFQKSNPVNRDTSLLCFVISREQQESDGNASRRKVKGPFFSFFSGAPAKKAERQTQPSEKKKYVCVSNGFVSHVVCGKERMGQGEGGWGARSLGGLGWRAQNALSKTRLCFLPLLASRSLGTPCLREAPSASWRALLHSLQSRALHMRRTPKTRTTFVVWISFFFLFFGRLLAFFLPPRFTRIFDCAIYART